jgi:hypothetical protein
MARKIPALCLPRTEKQRTEKPERGTRREECGNGAGHSRLLRFPVAAGGKDVVEGDGAGTEEDEGEGEGG